MFPFYANMLPVLMRNAMKYYSNCLYTGPDNVGLSNKLVEVIMSHVRRVINALS
jgi:hypothetical protein